MNVAVPDTADVLEEVDKIVTRLHEIVQIFGGFSGIQVAVE
jgi:hypothetical protein